jgi:Thioesterase-like superfamily
VEAVFGRRAGLATIEQLLATGVSREVIRSKVSRAVWQMALPREAEAGAWSVPEADPARIVRRSTHLPPMWANPSLTAHDGRRLPRPDGWFDDMGLAVHVHSKGYHAGELDWEATGVGGRRLRRARRSTRRRHSGQIASDPDGVLARIERAYRQARRRPARRRRRPASVDGVSDAFFTPLSGDGRRYRGEHACIGPWSPEFMHAGPPSALLVRVSERAAADAVPRLVAMRASVDILAPMPVGDVEVWVRVVRAGRRVSLTEAALTAGGTELLHARVWHVRPAEVPTPMIDQLGAPPVPAPHEGLPTLSNWTFPYARSLEWKVVHGDPVGPGPAAVWSRARIPVVAGEEPSGLQRAVLTADSGNGVSAELDWQRWSFVNVDLDVHLSRPLVGAWVLLDATTRYEPSGTALAASALSDEQGPVGRGAQTLVVAPRDRPARR